MTEVFDDLKKRIDVSYGESSEVNAKLDFAKGMIERHKIMKRLTIQYIEQVLQIAEAHQRCYVKVSPGNCSGISSTVTLHVEEITKE